jgi:hypothetical protein
MLCTGGTIARHRRLPNEDRGAAPDDVIAAARHIWRDEASVTSLLTPADGWQ